MSLLLDANAEYDLGRLAEKPPKEEIFSDFTEEFFEADESDKIMIHIETISNPYTFPSLLIHFSQVTKGCISQVSSDLNSN